MGVVVRRYIDILTIIINFTYSPLVLAFFSAAVSLLLCSFLKCFYFLFMSRSREYNYLIISIRASNVR